MSEKQLSVTVREEIPANEFAHHLNAGRFIGKQITSIEFTIEESCDDYHASWAPDYSVKCVIVSYIELLRFTPGNLIVPTKIPAGITKEERDALNCWLNKKHNESR